MTTQPTIQVDVWGIIDRNTGRLIIRAYEKLNDDASGRRQKGPASADEVHPFVEEWAIKGTIICSDRLRAYRDHLESMGYRWYGTNHSIGEYVRSESVIVRQKKRPLPVHSQGIDSIWRHMKDWMAKHAFHSLAYPFFVLEWQWRHNNQDADRFLLLLEYLATNPF